MKGFVKTLIKGLAQSYLTGSVLMAIFVKWGIDDSKDNEITKRLIANSKAHPIQAILVFLGWPVLVFDLLTDSRK